MSIGNRIKNARKNKGLTQKQLADKIHVSSQVISNFERGYTEIPSSNLHQIADILEVSTDYLLGKTDNIDRDPYWKLNEKDEKDIEKDLESILKNLDSDSALAFSGEPLDDETRELLAISLERSLRFAKQEAKKKFTPKKYRE